MIDVDTLEWVVHFSMTKKEAMQAIKEIEYRGTWGAPGDTLCLDGDFTVEELKAIVWWMTCMKEDLP